MSTTTRVPKAGDVVYFLSCTGACAHRGSRLEDDMRGQCVRLHDPSVEPDGSIAAWFTVLDGPASGEDHCAFFHYYERDGDRFVPNTGDVVRVTGFGPTSAHHGSPASEADLVGYRARVTEVDSMTERMGTLHAWLVMLDGPQAGCKAYSCDLLCQPVDHDFRDHGDTVVATAEHDIRAGDVIEIDPATGRARPYARRADRFPQPGETVEIRDSEGNATRGLVTQASYAACMCDRDYRDELGLTVLVERES